MALEEVVLFYQLFDMPLLGLLSFQPIDLDELCVHSKVLSDLMAINTIHELVGIESSSHSHHLIPYFQNQGKSFVSEEINSDLYPCSLLANW